MKEQIDDQEARVKRNWYEVKILKKDQKTTMESLAAAIAKVQDEMEIRLDEEVDKIRNLCDSGFS